MGRSLLNSASKQSQLFMGETTDVLGDLIVGSNYNRWAPYTGWVRGSDGAYHLFAERVTQSATQVIKPWWFKASETGGLEFEKYSGGKMKMGVNVAFWGGTGKDGGFINQDFTHAYFLGYDKNNNGWQLFQCDLASGNITSFDIDSTETTGSVWSLHFCREQDVQIATSWSGIFYVRRSASLPDGTGWTRFDFSASITASYLVFDTAGKLWLVGKDPATNADLIAVVSTDGGQTWATETSPWNGFIGEEPKGVIQNGDNIVLWATDGSNRLRPIYTNDAGVTWAEGGYIYDTTGSIANTRMGGYRGFYGDGVYIAPTNNGIAYSTNMASWTFVNADDCEILSPWGDQGLWASGHQVVTIFSPSSRSVVWSYDPTNWDDGSAPIPGTDFCLAHIGGSTDKYYEGSLDPLIFEPPIPGTPYAITLVGGGGGPAGGTAGGSTKVFGVAEVAGGSIGGSAPAVGHTQAASGASEGAVGLSFDGVVLGSGAATDDGTAWPGHSGVALTVIKQLQGPVGIIVGQGGASLSTKTTGQPGGVRVEWEA